MIMNKIDLIILKDLEKTSFLKSKSIYDFKILEAKNYNAVYKRVIRLEKIGYVEQGLKEGKMNTYFITNLGLEMLNKIK